MFSAAHRCTIKPLLCIRRRQTLFRVCVWICVFERREVVLQYFHPQVVHLLQCLSNSVHVYRRYETDWVCKTSIYCMFTCVFGSPVHWQLSDTDSSLLCQPAVCVWARGRAASWRGSWPRRCRSWHAVEVPPPYSTTATLVSVRPQHDLVLLICSCTYPSLFLHFIYIYLSGAVVQSWCLTLETAVEKTPQSQFSSWSGAFYASSASLICLF